MGNKVKEIWVSVKGWETKTRNEPSTMVEVLTSEAHLSLVDG